MNTTKANQIARCWLAAATLFAGGTVLGTCEVRVRDALVTTAQGAALTTVGCLPTMLGWEENSECTLFTGDATTDESE